MIFVDTHAHIYFDDFNEDRREMMDRALEAGVASVFNVGVDIESNREVMDSAESLDPVFAIIGFHPHEAKRFDAKEFEDHIAEHEGRYIGFGEFGLDYFYEHSPRRVQCDALEKQLELCIPAGLPLVFHCRDAQEDMMAIFRAAGVKLKGVMHCFSGDVEFLKQTLDAGLHISVGGPVTYPKNDELRKVVAEVPFERLMLETDCPYLSPQKKRGRRNEPSYIPMIAEKIAEVRGCDIEEVGRVTTRNAIELFGGAAAEWLECRIDGDADV